MSKSVMLKTVFMIALSPCEGVLGRSIVKFAGGGSDLLVSITRYFEGDRGIGWAIALLKTRNFEGDRGRWWAIAL